MAIFTVFGNTYKLCEPLHAQHISYVGEDFWGWLPSWCNLCVAPSYSRAKLAAAAATYEL